ncbi:GntR family transcriptional regulator [Erysipelatoclostridium sp. An173]|uniref:GntR family transcriptional regulator n=1 Tax=Erysipelatoclostridium sp. An173 TaxID=1965571 RepID=UPI000B387F03|nr:GntR family transcriptional regulator [Erysipelatoclostridium sp. An173]OUP78309.1 GntR family transcriptional regulator [Erysipelatoclostridium sp. An173]
MKNEFDPNLPIYLQVMEEIKKDIFVGKYHCGDKIASVRELALVYSVNPNTIQKALSELERTGIIYSKRAQGRYVSEDSNLIDDLKKEVSDQKIRTFLNKMMEIGYDKSMIIKMIEELD